jgi:5-methylthioadenosine/S-adenosylhomocysteine deaminase
MDLLLTGALVVTCDDQRRIMTDGAVAVRGTRIVAVGPAATLEADAALADLPRMSGRGLAVVPGLINAHTHTVLMVLRGTVEDWSGEAIYRYMSPVSYIMTPEERSVMAALGCLEAIRSGTASLVDPFRHVTGYAGAMAATGMRLFLSESCADVDTRRIRHGDYSLDPAFGQGFLDRATALIEGWHGAHNGRVQCQVAAHAPDNCSPAMLASLRDLASKHGLTRTVHMAQSRGEVAAVQQAHGLTPAFYLDREGFLGPDLVGAHWTFCTRDDIELLAERGTRMAHCPASISRRGLHPALIGPIRDAGVRIALGTDNMSEDMFQAMAVGSMLHRSGRGREQEGGVDPSPQEVLDMVTRNAADSVGALGETGSIEPGKLADLTLIDLDTAAMRPAIRPVSNIVHYGHPGIVHSVMVDGTFLMRDRKVLTIDEPALLAEAQAVTRRVWDRMVEANPDICRPEGDLQWPVAAG